MIASSVVEHATCAQADIVAHSNSGILLCNCELGARIFGIKGRAMSSLSRYVVVFAALAVLMVLITPALDELPCTAGHKSPVLVAMPLSAPLPVSTESSSNSQSASGIDPVLVVEDVHSLTCTFLC
jgi:hypothetical protein